MAGPWDICYPCARAAIPAISQHTCPVCSQSIDAPGEDCGNGLCRSAGRVIESIESVSVLEGALHSRIKSYKYQGRRGWRLIFGRLLLGHLEASPHLEADVIVANPTFVGPGARQTFPHTEAVLEEAQRQDLKQVWPFAPGLLRLIAEPPQSANQGYHAKKEAALARAELLEITDPIRVKGADVVVYDDVCTTGWQLEACARVLAAAGATSVRGLVLARKYWG